jgi:hypothetical protein
MKNENCVVNEDHEDLILYFTNDLRQKVIRFFLNNEKPNENNLNELINNYKLFLEYSYKNDLSSSYMSDDAKNILRDLINKELNDLKIFNEKRIILIY